MFLFSREGVKKCCKVLHFGTFWYLDKTPRVLYYLNSITHHYKDLYHTCHPFNVSSKILLYNCLNNASNRLHKLTIIHIHSLANGHLIRYTLLVPGWILFCLQNCLISSWHGSTRSWIHSSAILVHIDMIASRNCCTSMMRISHSTTSQMCSIGLRSGDCGGHFSKVNSLSCSRNQSEMI